MFRRGLHRIVLTRRWAAFVIMGLSFFGFGAGTLNLFYLLRANVELLTDYGWQALMDGGFRQSVELLLTGYASMAAYLVFKVCEHTLVHALVQPDERASAAQADARADEA